MISKAELQELIKLEADGHVIVGIDRVATRRFFTDVPLRQIERETGYAHTPKRASFFFSLLWGR